MATTSNVDGVRATAQSLDEIRGQLVSIVQQYGNTHHNLSGAGLKGTADTANIVTVGEISRACENINTKFGMLLEKICGGTDLIENSNTQAGADLAKVPGSLPNGSLTML